MLCLFYKETFLFVEMKLIFYQREASLILAKGAQAGLNTSNYLWIVTQVIVVVVVVVVVLIVVDLFIVVVFFIVIVLLLS